MSAYSILENRLREAPALWLVTGAAGFIGSNLVEELLGLGQFVVGLDNFATGNSANLDHIRAAVSPLQWERFRFVEGDVYSPDTCAGVCENIDYVLHQAALGSVPRSIQDPARSNAANVTGFLNMLVAAREAGVKRFVYASSSSVYGDKPNLPKSEEQVGNVLSPYAATKKFNEIYAAVFAKAYGLKSIGLRYFNVFGPRQDPEGAYAAVIPKWVGAMLKGAEVTINGDGETSRDFCYISNAVQANLLAATSENETALDQVYNIAVGSRTTLNELYSEIRKGICQRHPHLRIDEPTYGDFRPGDVRHSLADISKAAELLSYQPTHSVFEGIELALDWYVEALGPKA